MRRLNDITIQVDDRFGTPHNGHLQQPRPRTPPQRLRRRGISPFWIKRARRIATGVSLLALMTGVPTWLVTSGKAAELTESARLQLVALSARAGFRVEEIYVEGRHRTPREDLVAALQVQRGDPIFGIDLAATRQRLEEISWVKSATLERSLPGEVHILLTERDPIAIWQNEGHYYLVDKEGLVVGDQVQDFPDLPLIVGEGAPDHASALLSMLASEPDLQKRVKAAQWVSGRRWNLTFDRTQDGIDVRLPEESPTDSWHELAQIEREQQVMERKITLIDMRLPDRLVLRSTGGAEENSPAAEKAKRKTQPGKDA
jgi:cell division protein FtsQ